MAQAKPYFVKDGYSFLAYPNRNSVPFREFYNIPEADTVIRRSLRYEGNPTFLKALANPGWLDTDEKEWLKDGMSWIEIQQRAISAEKLNERYCVWSHYLSLFLHLLTTLSSSLVARIKEVCELPSKAESDRIISGLQWMGILSSTPATIRGQNLLDTLCAQLEKSMMFQPARGTL